MKLYLATRLIENGWVEAKPDWEYTKGDWFVYRDTSSWLMVGTADNPRVMDVCEPHEYEAAWMVNLIEHLCSMEDERVRLRKKLQAVEASENHDQSRAIAREALTTCFHSWLVMSPEKHYCPICGNTE